MDQLFRALGAEPVPYPPKVRCCGGMLMTTQETIALKLCNEILGAAVESSADMVATACPLCHVNLEGFQSKINKVYQSQIHIPIIYFTHLVGIALGLSPSELGLDRLLIEPSKLMKMKEVTTI